MAIQLSDPAIQELSVVFGHLDGKEYAPRNEEARILSVKGGEKGLIEKVAEAVKAYFSSNDDLLMPPNPFPVSEAEDNIDHDGDGPEDYNQIVSALCQVYSDISQAFGIGDDSARSAAIVKAIDSFLLGLDALRAGSEKAGARHSAADKAHIDALQEAHAKAKEAVDSMGDHLAALQPAPKPDEADKAKDKPYGDVEYADPKNGKYPIDTEEHARAAWSYINQEKNAAEYSADELATVKDRIRAACKKFGIEIESGKAAEVDMTQEEVQAMIAEALAVKDAEKAAAVEAANAEAQAKIDEANAAAEAAKAQAQAEADAAKAEAEKAAEAQRAAEAKAEELKAEAIKAARTPTATSQQSVQASSRLQDAVKAALVGAGSSVI